MTTDLLARIESTLLPPTRFVGDTQRFNLKERMQHYAVPGVSVAVFDGGEPVAARGYGVRSVPDGPPVDESTRFQAASMSKVVTALLVMQLVDAGAVALDADVNRYLRRWQIPASPLTDDRGVTLRRILTHRAGLTVHGFRGYPRPTPIPDVLTVLRGEDGITGPVIVDIPPDSEHRYSGGGTTVAQLVIEEQTGQSFAALAAERVFAPLSLTATTFEQPMTDAPALNLARGYRPDASEVPGGWHNFAQLGAAGLWTTPLEFGRILAEIHRAWHGRSALLSKRSAREMLNRPYGDQRGLGPMVYGSDANPRFFHDGDNQGYHCAGTCYAATGQGAVVMTNGDLGPALWREIFGAIADTCTWPDFIEASLARYPLDAAALARYAGDYEIVRGYEATAPFVVRVDSDHADGDGLLATLPGVPSRRMLPISATDFRSRATPFTARFTLDARSRAQAVTILEGDDVLITAQRFKQ
jgi:CubicO group peptidase (beta-lactamase class C family)